MGITILAIGMSIPETISSIIVTQQGHGEMGISNSIGSNIFDILLCLGIPWFIKTYFLIDNNNNNDINENWIILNSSGLIYSISSLLITIFGFYIVFIFNKFHLNHKTGIIHGIMYFGFISIAIVIEMKYFYELSSQICQH